MNRSGFTLIEMMISLAVGMVVVMLSYLAFSSSHEAVRLNSNMAALQSDSRNAMRALGKEVQLAVKRPEAGLALPAGAKELTITAGNPGELTFVVPTDNTGAAFSNVVTVRFESEDKPDASVENGEFGNARLDPGEDTNGDGMLTRQLVLIQDGRRRVLGSANSLANVTFGLSEDGSRLLVNMTAAVHMAVGGGGRLLRYDSNSAVFLMN